MKTKYFLALITFCSILGFRDKVSSLNSTHDKTLPHLTAKIYNLIANKKDMEVQQGCIISHTTVGESELNTILADMSDSLNADSKIELCIAILKDDNLYHLHDRAGIELHKLIDPIAQYERIRGTSPGKMGYVLLRIDHPLTQVLDGRFIELDAKHREAILRIIKYDSFRQITKRYFIEALYSLSFSGNTGHKIHTDIAESSIHSSLKEYSDSLYLVFQEYKPRFERLNSIRTWMEMNGKSDSIKELFEDSHPIMFLQILSFNPSTVLDSKKLSTLKQEALTRIMNSAGKESFYSAYRLAYLNELLIDRNYTVRFLDSVMTSREKQLFINQLENTN